MPSEETHSPKDSRKKRCEILEQSVFSDSVRLKHYRKMRSAIWLFLYLLDNAEQKTGELKRNFDAISTDMGIARSTIQRWLKMLRSSGYVETGNTGRLLTIRIKSRNETAGASNMTHQVSQKWDSRCLKNEAAHDPLNNQKNANLKQEMTIDKKNQKASPIDRSINNKLNIDIDREDPPSPSPNRRFADGHGVKSKAELLALDLATALDDIKALPLYISYVRKYPEQLLRRVLGVVMEIPPEKVKKSRGALFNFLVQKYGHQKKNYSGD